MAFLLELNSFSVNSKQMFFEYFGLQFNWIISIKMLL